MRKLHLLVLLPAFFIPLSQAKAASCSAVNRENCVYVSTLTGNKVYLFDASTKTATVINDGSGRVVPELPAALVEGPDKLLYYADVSACADASTYVIRRFDPFAPVGADGLNTTVETVLAGGSICPAGLTFDFEGNLYANTQPFTGVYKIVKVQHCKTQIPVSKVPLGELNGSATALTVLPATSTSSTGGAAIFFSNSGGNLLFVGQNPDQVLFSDAVDPPFSTAVPLITAGLSNPIGAVQDNAGKIFITNNEARNVIRCDSDGKDCDEFATFADSEDRPVYSDTNSEGNLFVATEQIAGSVIANGKIWVLTGPGPCPGSNCELAGSIPEVDGQTAPAHGIGLSATSAIRSGVFDTEFDITSRIFDFGSSFFLLSYPKGLLTTHTVTVKAQEVFPGDLTFTSRATSCNSYHGKKGKCVVYELVDFIPRKDVDYKKEYSVYIKHSGQVPIQPAMLHDSRALQDILLAGGPDFPDNIFDRFDLGPPGVDPGTGGKSTDNFTAYVSADLGPLPEEELTAFFRPPLDETQITVVQRGRTLPVKIHISDEDGNTVREAIVRLGVARIDGDSLFPDEVRSNVNSENIFRIQRNIYIYNLLTDDLALGLHVLTAVSDPTSSFKIPAVTALIFVRP